MNLFSKKLIKLKENVQLGQPFLIRNKFPNHSKNKSWQKTPKLQDGFRQTKGPLLITTN